MFLDDTACNLGSANLIKFVDENGNFINESEFQPIGLSDTIVYQSDSEGAPVVFYIKYRLKISREQMSGFYQTDINYSLTTE